jgi:hypothetical protein
MSRDDLIQRNLAAFDRHQPAVAALLRGIGQTASVAEHDADGAACNILVGGSERLYPGAAKEWAAGQVTALLAEGQRIIFADLGHCNITRRMAPLFAPLIETCRTLVGGPLAGAPVVDIGYVFVFGVGLGYHVEELLRRVAARILVLVEPVPQFLLHSLAAVDWSALFDLAAEQGKSLQFVTAQQPAELCRQLEACVVRNGRDFIDGSYFMFHYYSWALKEAYAAFSLRIRHLYTSTGHFEDETRMMTNACGNMRRHGFHICEDKPFLPQGMPVFVVGSGPSLDNDLDFIRHWRDKVVLISSGTSLGILLQHGLRPDLHTETENGPKTFPILERLHREYGLHGIHLAASLTVDPQVPALFDRCWFFLRHGPSPSRLLAGIHNGLFGSDPTVANASLAVATAIGFSEIYLFGIDCGVREGCDRHHSRHSIYFTEHAPIETDELMARYDRVLPGNFGGRFRTEWVFDMTALVIAEVRRRRPALKLFNCSDGARIDGALPKAAEAIDLSHLPAGLDPARVLDQVESQMARYRPGELLSRLDRDRQVAGCRALAAAVRAAMAAARHCPDRDFWDFRRELARIYDELRVEAAGALAVAGPTLANVLRGTIFYGVRIKDAQLRHRFFLHVLDALEGPVQALFDDTATLFDSLLDGGG